MEFMVSATFRAEDRAEIMPRIGPEQEHIKALREQGVVEELYVSSNLSQVWIVMQGESEAVIRQYLQGFPLYPYMQLEVAQLSKM